MLNKTRGIVLGHINYKDSSIIARIYTEEFGLRSYIVNSVKSSRKGNKMAYFQSLSLLDMVVYENEKKDIQRISEYRLFYPFQSIPFQQKKIVIAMFISELLLKALKEESSNKIKFDFLINEIKSFDSAEKNFQNFHLEFMIKLCVFLGFAPGKAEDFKNAGIALNMEKEKILNSVLYSNEMPKNGYDRSIFLDIMIKYYQYHIDNFNTFKSINILKDVIHN